MVLRQEDIETIMSYVKKEPCTVQDIATLLGRSWLTANSYVKKIEKETGLLRVKTFRKGSQGALKVVYANYGESLIGDQSKADLLAQIQHGRDKTEFDVLELFTQVPENKRRMSAKPELKAFEKLLIKYLAEATETAFLMSGNLSFLSKAVLVALEKALARGVIVRVLCRIKLSTLGNLNPLLGLLEKFPKQLELRHRFQPLRGVIIDGKAAFREEEKAEWYRKGEMAGNATILYEIYDAEWLEWVQQMFWTLYRSARDAPSRLQSLNAL